MSPASSSASHRHQFACCHHEIISFIVTHIIIIVVVVVVLVVVVAHTHAYHGHRRRHLSPQHRYCHFSPSSRPPLDRPRRPCDTFFFTAIITCITDNNTLMPNVGSVRVRDDAKSISCIPYRMSRHLKQTKGIRQRSRPQNLTCT